MGNESGGDAGARSRRDAPTEVAPASGSVGPRRSQEIASLITGGRLCDGRFELRRRLGAGGMGVVYEGFDSAQGTTVAVKTLTHLEASSLYFLKNEFRALADVVHPNLVALHGLYADGDNWFITMELVDGVPFVEHVSGAVDLDVEPALRAGLSRLDVLYPALRQLVQGVQAIHAAGKIHRDLKPSNVLVGRDGRVVILDFGLAADAAQEAAGQTVHGGILGTPAYMAPEQLLGHAASSASDWYAVGVMLYQALTGELPHSGRFHEVFAAKQKAPPHPRALEPSVPPELDALCVSLLASDAASRPSAARILGALGADGSGPDSSVASISSPVVSQRSDAVFVGREEELVVLERAFQATESGSAAAVLVSGASGMGKTALVERFLASHREGGRTVVLSGRCYERESLAYKALDALVDSLTRYLRRTPGSEAFLPRDLRALVRVFPVLERVEVIAESPQRRGLPADPQELRRRAFGALREMFERIADRAPLIVFVDDLQWGDVDSAEIIREILAPPDPPAMLFVGTHRSEERERSACLRALLDESGGPSGIPWVHVPIGSLREGESAELATKLLGVTGPAAEAVKREGKGSPFFITELVRYLEHRVTGDDPSSPAVLTLDKALHRRVSSLPETARAALEVLSVAARPILPAMLGEVSGLGVEVHAALRTLTSVKLARTVGQHDAGAYATYHDRIRESVAARLDRSRLTAVHRALAEALEREDGADVDAIAEHFLAAEEPSRAAVYAARAAALSEGALAFDRAARLYAIAVEHGTGTEEERRALQVRRGEVLVNAGRNGEAASAFLGAATGAETAAAAALRRRAAEQLLLGGHLDAGLSMLRETATELGLELPGSPEEADVALFGTFTELQQRGMDFTRREEPEIGAAALTRVDLTSSLALAELTLDSSEGTLWTLRQLLAALEAGEPRRVLRGLSLYALCTGGLLPADGTLERIEQLERSLDVPDARAWASFARGVLPYWRGRFLEAVEGFARAETTFRDECRGSHRELGAVRLMLTSALWHAEDVERVMSTQARYLADARERNDLYLVTWSYVRAHYTRIAEDQAELGLSEVEEGVRRWGRDRVDFITWQSNIAFSMLDRARGGTGYEYITRHWEQILRNPGFSECPVHRALTRREHAFAAIEEAARDAGRRAELLAIAEKDAEFVAGTGILGGAAFADLVRGAVRSVEGDPGGALGAVTRAFEGYSGGSQYALTTALLERQRGKLLGGDEGAALVAHAERTITSQGVRSVERWARVFLPGFS